MKTNIRFFLLSCIVYANLTEAVAPYYSIRSQSVDLARQVVGVRDIEEDLKCSECRWPGYIGATVDYTQSFNPKDISHCLFDTGSCQSINVSGSGVANRGANDWLADNFGLPINYQSTLNFDPQITNVIADIQGYIRLDKWSKKCFKKIYLYVHAPLVYTKWNLHVCEDFKNAGIGYAAGYFAPGAVSASALSPSASAYLSGQFAPTIAGVTFNKLANARWAIGDCGSLTKTKFADLRMWLGYDWRNCNRYDIGFGLVVAAPTGSRPEADYLFEPIVGNGKHWELGFMAKGDFVVWENCDGTHMVTLFTQANITHLFKAKQRRTFDLIGKPMSRYMLAEQMGPNTTFLFSNPVAGSEDPATTTKPSNQFAGIYTAVANLTTLCVDVSTNVQVDWVAMATYSRCNFTWDLGYELWYRGCEKITAQCTPLIAENAWALKGDAFTFGFANETLPPITQGSAIALSATESGATINAGTNNGSGINTGVDNSQFALFGQVNTNVGAVVSVDVIDQQKTSNNPVFIKSSDIDLCGARTSGLTNKIFTHFSYYWDCECTQPFVGFGGMGEFASKRSNNCSTVCDTNNNCQRCALSQWGVWIKGGFVFG